MFVGKAHKLYQFFKELYEKEDGKTGKNFKHSIELDTSLSNGIGGRVWFDEYVVFEGDTFTTPLRFLCPDIEDNRVLSVHFHDPVYDSEYVFQTKILDGTK